MIANLSISRDSGITWTIVVARIRLLAGFTDKRNVDININESIVMHYEIHDTAICK